MSEIKTKATDLDVDTFLMSVEPAKKEWILRTQITVIFVVII